ncbi:Protein NYNRIN, partial [Mucuna pruriens]
MVVPIFGALKKGESFVWTAECEVAFLWLKAMLAAPPILTRPTPGTPLYLYISVSDTAVSVILIQEKEGTQHPIYFTSKKERYQKIEKAVLTLVITSWRLRPYFQGANSNRRVDS